MVMFVRGIEDRGVPDMIPVDEWNDRPIGRDPDIMENDRSSPSQGRVGDEISVVLNDEDGLIVVER